MKTAIVLLALSFLLPLIGETSANNDRRPIGKLIKLHEVISKSMPKKARESDDVKFKWIIGKTFTGTAKVKPAKKKKDGEYNTYSISAAYADGIMTEEAQRVYDQFGSKEYILRVTYKKVNGKLYCEIQKMWPVKK